ncbi:pyridoxamine 5'-phosphate oxidase family protein [Streptomyces sp. NPDC055078]
MSTEELQASSTKEHQASAAIAAAVAAAAAGSDAAAAEALSTAGAVSAAAAASNAAASDTAGSDTAAEELRAIELLSRVSYGRLATSMRAMPFVAPARHIVLDGGVLLRIHRGFGYHRACNGSVVAYEADNFSSGGKSLWSVQFTGMAEIVQPARETMRLFGDEPHQADGERFEPVHMRLEPQFVTVHTLDYREEQPTGHAA